MILRQARCVETIETSIDAFTNWIQGITRWLRDYRDAYERDRWIVHEFLDVQLIPADSKHNFPGLALLARNPYFSGDKGFGKGVQVAVWVEMRDLGLGRIQVLIGCNDEIEGAVEVMNRIHDNISQTFQPITAMQSAASVSADTTRETGNRSTEVLLDAITVPYSVGVGNAIADYMRDEVRAPLRGELAAQGLWVIYYQNDEIGRIRFALRGDGEYEIRRINAVDADATLRGVWPALLTRLRVQGWLEAQPAAGSSGNTVTNTTRTGGVNIHAPGGTVNIGKVVGRDEKSS